jgi:hypothetical protein
VEDVALHARAIQQRDAVGPDDTFNPTANDHLIGCHTAIDRSVFAHNQASAADVAVDLAVDLQFTVTCKVACDK